MNHRTYLATAIAATGAALVAARRHLELVPPPDTEDVRYAIDQVATHEAGSDYVIGVDADVAAQHCLRLAAAAASTWRPWLWAKVPGLQRQGTAFALVAIGLELRAQRLGDHGLPETDAPDADAPAAGEVPA